MRNELQCLEDLAGMPKFVSICTIPFADGMLLEVMRTLLKILLSLSMRSSKEILMPLFRTISSR